MTNINQYADKIDKAVRLLLNSITGDDDIGYAIVMLLLENDGLTEEEIVTKLVGEDNDLSASEIEEYRDEISNRLSKLQTGGFVARHPGEQIGDPTTGTYEVTTVGENLMWGIYEATTDDEQPEARQ